MDGLYLVEFGLKYFNLSKIWLADDELRYLIHAGELPSEEERLRWFEELSHRTDYLIWGIEYKGQPIGVSGLKHIIDGQAEYWGYIGEKDFWGKGLGKILMYEILQKAKELELARVYLRVRKYNSRAYKMYLKSGFSVDNENDDVYCMSFSV